MAVKKSAASKVTESSPMFDKQNYLWMLAGILIIALGMLLMGGGKSNDPNQFHPDQVYSARRITVAPILILAGFVIEIFAIFRKTKKQQKVEG